jgi:xanthine dehydrogenase accessory factor
MSIFQALADLDSKGERGVLCTIVSSQGSTPRHAGSKMVVYPDGHYIGSVGGGELESRVISDALNAIENGKSRLLEFSMVDPKAGDPGICGGSVEIYLEVIMGKPEILIIGGGHVGRAVAHLAKWLGFRVGISDDRPEFCTPEANPDADEFYPVSLADLPKVKTISPTTYLILTTRGVAVDVPGLPALLATNAGYIGIIGSKRRWMTTRKELENAGVAQEKIQKVQSPMGLELNAETPEEIAVSILAEIIMLRNGGTGHRMHM